MYFKTIKTCSRVTKSRFWNFAVISQYYVSMVRLYLHTQVFRQTPKTFKKESKKIFDTNRPRQPPFGSQMEATEKKGSVNLTLKTCVASNKINVWIQIRFFAVKISVNEPLSSSKSIFRTLWLKNIVLSSLTHSKFPENNNAD